MKKYLVIGNPIEHSLSPVLHNYWIKENKINAIYEKQKINENEIQRTFFTNYGHQQGAKMKGVLLPNSMLANIYITLIAQNDKGMVNIS